MQKVWRTAIGVESVDEDHRSFARRDELQLICCFSRAPGGAFHSFEGPPVHHYIAFLRGMNLGKRRLPMEQLRRHFQKLGFSDVATFIASGNVIFSSKHTDARKLETQIEDHLNDQLGYEVDTFLRTRSELEAVVAFVPFPECAYPGPDLTIHVGFLKHRPDTATARALEQVRTDVDQFRVNGREFYWLCRIKTNESKVWTSADMKAVKLPTLTMRNLTTVRKLAGLYPVLPS